MRSEIGKASLKLGLRNKDLEKSKPPAAPPGVRFS